MRIYQEVQEKYLKQINLPYICFRLKKILST